MAGRKGKGHRRQAILLRHFMHSSGRQRRVHEMLEERQGQTFSHNALIEYPQVAHFQLTGLRKRGSLGAADRVNPLPCAPYLVKTADQLMILTQIKGQ